MREFVGDDEGLVVIADFGRNRSKFNLDGNLLSLSCFLGLCILIFVLKNIGLSTNEAFYMLVCS